jgi:uncharacterized protein
MDSYSFFCYGHSNILGNHYNTLEFTKDEELTLQGDCIIGVKADFKLLTLKEFLSGKEKIKIIITCEEISDSVECLINKDFNDAHEIVIRKSEFNSKRTLGIRANKAAIDLKRELIEKMKIKDNKINVNLIKQD